MQNVAWVDSNECASTRVRMQCWQVACGLCLCVCTVLGEWIGVCVSVVGWVKCCVWVCIVWECV